MHDFRTRYQNEAKIGAAVTSMLHMLEDNLLTVHEIAECAVLAAQLYSERNCCPVVLVLEHRNTK